jgi:hypothetical protein
MEEAARAVADGAFDSCFNVTMKAALKDGLNQACAQEGTVWLLDPTRSFLIPRFNSGPDAGNFVGVFRQSVQSGMIGMVVATEQPICENAVDTNNQQDRSLDIKLGVTTCSMLAVPFYFAGQLRGVISAVQLKRPDATTDPTGFSPENLRTLQLTADVIERLVEHELLTFSLGLGTAAW